MPLAEEISNLKELQQFVIFKRNGKQRSPWMASDICRL